MAMQQMVPVRVEVAAHWRTGVPQAVAFEGISRKVTKILALRRETAAYPSATGPRTLWELETEDAALVVAYLRRQRAWTIVAYDDAWATLPFASTLESYQGALQLA